MQPVKILMIGCGNVGKAFLQMLERRARFLEASYGVFAQFVAICTRTGGNLVNESGLDVSNGVPAAPADGRSVFELLDTLDYDVMIELTPLNIRTGQPAIDHIRHALKRGKAVITANKGPIALAYRELRDLAKTNGGCLFHEATVMDGVPVFSLARQTLQGCRILAVEGVLNATSNFVLQELEKGTGYEEAVRLGQEKGIVEREPSMDLDGWDAAVKLTALMNVLMDVQIRPDEIVREGIGSITRMQLEAARAQGKTIKVVCRGWLEDGRPRGEVRPRLVDNASTLASINGTAAGLTLTTDLLGPITIIEQEFTPEIDQTAYGVFGDLLRVLETRRDACAGR